MAEPCLRDRGFSRGQYGEMGGVRGELDRSKIRVGARTRARPGYCRSRGLCNEDCTRVGRVHTQNEDTLTLIALLLSRRGTTQPLIQWHSQTSVRPVNATVQKEYWALQKRILLNRFLLMTPSHFPRRRFSDLSSGADSITLEDVIQPLEPVKSAIPLTGGRCLEMPDSRDFRMVRHDDKRAFAPVTDSQKSMP